MQQTKTKAQMHLLDGNKERTMQQQPRGVKINNFQPANNSPETEHPSVMQFHLFPRPIPNPSSAEKKQQFHFCFPRFFIFFFWLGKQWKTWQISLCPIRWPENCWVATKQDNRRRKKLTLMMMSWRLESVRFRDPFSWFFGTLPVEFSLRLSVSLGKRRRSA